MMLADSAGDGDSDAGRGLSRREIGAVAAFAAILFLPFLGSYHALTEHEVFVAGTARQMVQEGNWIALKIGDQFWLEKPPLPHWLVACSAAVCGGFTEASVRLPSAVCGIGVAVLVAWIACRQFGRRIGFLAGLVQASAQYMVAYSRLAEADMPLLLLVMGAIALFVRIQWSVGEPIADAERRATLGFWALVGLMNAVKGPLFGSVLTLLTCGGWLAVCRDWRGLRRLWSTPGVMLAAVIAFAWPALVAWREPAAVELWRSHLFGRAAGSLGYRQPFYYYLTTWPVQLLPWTPMLIVGAVPSLKRAARDWRSTDGFVWWWMLSQAFVLSLSSGKHHHYLIYALPAMSPVIAGGLIEAARLVSQGARSAVMLGRGLRYVAFPALVAAAVIGSSVAGPFSSDVSAAGGLLAVGALTLGILLARPQPGMVFVALLTFVAGGNWLVQGFIMPRHDRSGDDKAFLLAVDARLPRETPVIATGGCEIARHIFYLQRTVDGVWEPDDLGGHFDPSRPAYVIARGHCRAKLERYGSVEPIEQSASTRREASAEDRYTLFRVVPGRGVATSRNALDAAGIRRE